MREPFSVNDCAYSECDILAYLTSADLLENLRRFQYYISTFLVVKDEISTCCETASKTYKPKHIIIFFRGIPIFKGLAPLALKINVREYDINIPSKEGLLTEAFLALFLTHTKKSVLFKCSFNVIPFDVDRSFILFKFKPLFLSWLRKFPFMDTLQT